VRIQEGGKREGRMMWSMAMGWGESESRSEKYKSERKQHCNSEPSNADHVTSGLLQSRG
jgi:hypothetical protein